jgi:predicted GNAT family acetyltransferase
MAATPPVTNDTAAEQFEIRTDGGTALLRYRRQGNALDLLHTEVPAAFEGQGYGAALARSALDYARAERLKVIPSCPFVARYLERHREYADLVAAD